MKTFFIFAALSHFSISAQACEFDELTFPNSNLCAKVEWLQGPNFNQYNSIEVTLNKETTLKLNVVPWMVMNGGHEHGSRPVKVTANSSTEFSVEKIYFMGGMVGEWYLRFQLLNSENKIVEEVRFQVELTE